METTPTEQLLARIAYLEDALGTYGAQIRSLNDSVHTLQVTANAIQPTSEEPRVGISEMLKMRRLFQAKPRQELSSRLPELVDELSFSDQLEKLKAKGYGAYDEWYKLLQPNLVSYQEQPEAGISVEENEGANMFRDFVAPYSQGSVLDIGCGIAEMPVYLADFDADLTIGSDPLCPELSRNFKFHHGLAELLPFDQECFDNVIIATSMDHFLDPELALREAKRVLKPQGRLLLWMGFIPNSVEYDPMNPDISPVDDYHLFHFDKVWFEPMLTKHFSIEEHLPVNSVSSFYACSPKS